MLWLLKILFSKRERLGRRLMREVERSPHLYSPPRLEEVRRLLDAGANVNYTRWGDSILSMAGRSPWCSAEVVQLLLERGANVNGTQRPGLIPPLLRAAHDSDNGRLRLLIDAGADVNIRDRWGRTPLSELCYWADAEIVEYLLENGADPNRVPIEYTGWLPLHLAACVGRADLVALLVNHGADVQARDKNGDTPADVAANRPGSKRSPYVTQDFGAVLQILRSAENMA